MSQQTQTLARAPRHVYRPDMKTSTSSTILPVLAFALVAALGACGEPCTPDIRGGLIVDADQCNDSGSTYECQDDSDCNDREFCDLTTAMCEPIVCTEDPPTPMIGEPWGPCDVSGECLQVDGQPANFCIPTGEGKICLPACEQEQCPASLGCFAGTCGPSGTCNPGCAVDADCIFDGQMCDQTVGFCVYSA